MKCFVFRVNVIFVIGWVDLFIFVEFVEMKKFVMEDIEYYCIFVYNFFYDIEEDDEDIVEENVEFRGFMLFVIVGLEDIIEIGGC